MALTSADVAPRSSVIGRTLAHDETAERRIERDLEAIAAAVRERLGGWFRALLLTGGYARREGSLVLREGRLQAYNDYDLIAVVIGRPARWREPLAALGREQSKKVGVDVDIWPVGADDLPRVPATLFWLDVSLGGAEVVAGDVSVLERLRVLGSREVPLDECGRLLANRATGLALSNLERDDHDFRRARHAHKAVLAVGDALLLSANRYRGTLEARLAELERLVDAPAVGTELVEAYRDAVSFRARPDAWRPREAPERWYARIRERVGRWHLAYEAWRVGAPATTLELARFRGRLFPNLPDVRPGGALLASLRASIAGDLPLLPWLGHPRERLARAAAALAYSPVDPAVRAEAARLLGCPNDDRALHRALGVLSARGG